MDVSFIVIIYNVKDYIQECLDSVWNNAHSMNAEVLLIDDGSTDGCSELARAFANAHDRVMYYFKENGGASTARNFGVQHAKGDYLYFVDGDDVMVQGTVHTMLNSARLTGAQITVCDALRLEKSGKVRSSTLHTVSLTTVPKNLTNIREHPELLYDCLSWDKLILRSFYIQSGVKFPEGFAIQDYPTITELYLQAERVGIVREVGYLWRVREGENLSTTQQHMKRKNLTDRIEMVSRVFALLQAYDASDAIRFVAEKKLLALDFGVYLPKLCQMSDADAKDYVELMGSCVDALVRPESIKKMPLKARQRANFLRKRDVEGLIRLENYFATSYDKAYVKKSGNSLDVKVPNSIFSVPSRNYLPDVQNAIPRSRVENVEVDGAIITLTGFLFTPRFEIADYAEQEVNAWLINDTTGVVVPLECVSCMRERNSQSYVQVVSHEDYLVHSYDYSGTGFRIAFDLAALDAVDGLNGANQIVLDYKNWVQHSTRVLRGSSQVAQTLAKGVIRDDGRYAPSLSWDKRGTLILNLLDRGESIAPGIREADLEPHRVALVLLENPAQCDHLHLVSCLLDQTYKNVLLVVQEGESVPCDDKRVVTIECDDTDAMYDSIAYACELPSVDYVLPIDGSAVVDTKYVQHMVDGAAGKLVNAVVFCNHKTVSGSSVQLGGDGGRSERIACSKFDFGKAYGGRVWGDTLYSKDLITSSLLAGSGRDAQRMFAHVLRLAKFATLVRNTVLGIVARKNEHASKWQRSFEELRVWRDVATMFDGKDRVPHDSAQQLELECAYQVVDLMAKGDYDATVYTESRKIIRQHQRACAKEQRKVQSALRKTRVKAAILDAKLWLKHRLR